jgi:hypothetical protein
VVHFQMEDDVHGVRGADPITPRFRECKGGFRL